jgi:hypothetical protein
MAKAKGNKQPIRQSVHVDCPIEEAFRIFTEEFGQWWPLASYSQSGEEAEACEIEPWVDGRVLERTRSGEEHEWATVTVWDPPRRVQLEWQDHRQVVEVEFHVEADGTRVTLAHTGWHLAGVETCALSRFCGLVEELLVPAN